MKCAICDQRRANRHCPAQNAEICSLCCGTQRCRKIACPEDCEYLLQGRRAIEARSEEFEVLRKVRDADPAFMSALEYAILEIQRTRFRDLKDQDVKAAIDDVYKTIQTEEKGILYQYRSSDPRIALLTSSVTKTVELFRSGQRGVRVGSEEVKACLLAILNAVKMTTNRNPDSTDYIDLIVQYARDTDQREHPTGLIYLP
ncbi:MAG: hypothetical protein ABIK62_02420 [candidate division WOR-3 bacterium]